VLSCDDSILGSGSIQARAGILESIQARAGILDTPPWCAVVYVWTCYGPTRCRRKDGTAYLSAYLSFSRKASAVSGVEKKPKDPWVTPCPSALIVAQQSVSVIVLKPFS